MKYYIRIGLGMIALCSLWILQPIKLKLLFSGMLFLLGIVSNLIVILSNNWYMPAKISKKIWIFKNTETKEEHRCKKKDIRFWFLGDIFPLIIKNKKHKIGLFFSIGDVLLFLGAILYFIINLI